jgi:HPt (histidine-containing phosphotransfer) domain-containing protein
MYKKNVVIPDVPDFTELHRVSGGDVKFIKRMMQIFKSQTENSMEYILDNLEKENYIHLRKEAHRLLSPVKQLKLNKISNTIEQIEDTCLKDKNKGKLTMLIKELQMQMDVTLPELERRVNTLTNR